MVEFNRSLVFENPKFSATLLGAFSSLERTAGAFAEFVFAEVRRHMARPDNERPYWPGLISRRAL
jgi:hypothetical protein